ncbi:MAG: 6-bladed beta-propeller [Gemmatimonadota bacterium]
MPGRSEGLRRSAATLLLGAVAACGGVEGTADSGAGVRVTDSAGVAIVSNEGPLLTGADRWVVDLGEEGRYGYGDDPDEGLMFPMAARSLSDGRVVVGDQGTRQLKLFSPDGRFLQSVGRDGEGPGEFRSVFGLWVTAGDTLVVWDIALARLTRFDAAGRHIASRALPGDPTPPVLLGLLPDGSPVGTFPAEDAFESAMTRPPGTRIQTQDALARFDGAGRAPSTIASRPGDVLEVTRFEGAPAIGSPRFSPQPTWALHDARIFYTPAASFEVQMLDGNGALQWITRRPEGDLRITDEMIAAYKAWAIRLEEANPDRFRGTRARMEDAVFPERKPSVGTLLVDARGNVWARPVDMPFDSLADWSVFSPEGRWITDVTVPGMPWTILEIGDAHLLARTTDALDVPYIVRVPLRKPGGTPSAGAR